MWLASRVILVFLLCTLPRGESKLSRPSGSGTGSDGLNNSSSDSSSESGTLLNEESCDLESFKDNSYDPTETLTGKLPAQPNCGKQYLDTSSSSEEDMEELHRRVVGGQKAEYGQWPWQVAVGKTVNGTIFSLNCGGALIYDRWVLTAAHCINYVGEFMGNPCEHVLRFGEHNLASDVENHVDIPAERVFMNPFWRLHPPHWDGFDVALVKLKRPAPRNKYINTLCLPETGFTLPTGTEVQLAGWGNTNPLEPAFPDTMQHVTLQYITIDDCNTTSNWRGRLVVEWLICAGDPPEGGKSSCRGDSGGSLVYQRADGTYVGTGIVYLGVEPCGQTGHPGLFVDVANSKVMHWIESTIHKHGLN